MKYILTATVALALIGGPALADTPQSILDQAMLIGPAQFGETNGQLTIYGQAGPAIYSADLSGSDCRVGGSDCDQIMFQSFAPPAEQSAIDAWNAGGYGGTLTLDQGWLWLTSDAQISDGTNAAFSDWNTLLTRFSETFDT